MLRICFRVVEGDDDAYVFPFTDLCCNRIRFKCAETSPVYVRILRENIAASLSTLTAKLVAEYMPRVVIGLANDLPYKLPRLISGSRTRLFTQDGCQLQHLVERRHPIGIVGRRIKHLHAPDPWNTIRPEKYDEPVTAWSRD